MCEVGVGHCQKRLTRAETQCTEEVELEDQGTALETVGSFRYLCRTLMTSDSDWPMV